MGAYLEQVKIKEIFVLQVLTKLELGGAQKVCLTLFNGVENSPGFKSGMVSGTDGFLVSEVQGQENVFLLPEFQREIGFKIFLSDIKAFWAIYRLIKKLRKTHPHLIVHTHSTKAGFFGRWAAFFAGVRVRVHTVHGFGFNELQAWPKKIIMMIFEFLASLVTTHYICVAEKDRAQGGRLFPRFLAKSSIIRAAVDWESFYLEDKWETNSKKLVIGTVSCFKLQKNLIDLLKAFKLILNNLIKNKNKIKIELQIVGDGIMRAQLEDFVKENELQSHVVFLGWQNPVSEILKNWDIFAMSSLWEGLACAVVEARLSKLPVVCYDVGGLYEVVKNGKNGFLVTPKNWQDLAEKLSLLVVDDKLRLEMGNYKENLEDFKNDSMLRKHVFLYKNLLNGK